VKTIVTTYKAIGRSIINYAAPIWSPELSDTQWRNIQTRQNNALRIATGCHSITHPDHLHDETTMLKVQQHNTLLTQQFLLTCLNPAHPTHAIATTPLPHRNIRTDFRTHLNAVSNFIPDNWDPPSIRAALSELHQHFVHVSTSSLAPNRVLNVRPPPIHDSEKSLPRDTRCVLSQLRSGWCSILMSYQARTVGSADVCPACQASPHDTSHLFNCPSHPTQLSAIDLWSRPIEAAQHIGLRV